jgi:hypothetical protein
MIRDNALKSGINAALIVDRSGWRRVAVLAVSAF